MNRDRRREPSASIPYLWSDAWLLLSAILAGSPAGATLEGIVSAGDAVNHAIFTFQELDGGLARLLAGSLVRIDGERVFPTDQATALYARVSKRGGSMLTQMERIGRQIGAPAWSTSHDPNKADSAWSLAHLSANDLKRAYTGYKRQFASAQRTLEKRGR